jgi:transcriptional regulator with XRE-family HTH domain
VIRHIDLPGGTFAANLRAAREAHGWSVADLASRTGLDQSTVYRWEQEQRQPTLPAILTLASTFSMTGSELIEGI